MAVPQAWMEKSIAFELSHLPIMTMSMIGWGASFWTYSYMCLGQWFAQSDELLRLDAVDGYFLTPPLRGMFISWCCTKVASSEVCHF